jgi:SAM-dependent methyltransferase
VTEPPGPLRPRRADVTSIYDRGAAAYQALWSPVILPPAAVLVRSLGLHGRCVVADVGAGTGALLGAIRSAAPAARVAALDASAGMLHIARTRHDAPAVLADALALPLTDGVADAVILAYVLFHLADPARAVAEAARVPCAVSTPGLTGPARWKHCCALRDCGQHASGLSGSEINGTSHRSGNWPAPRGPDRLRLSHLNPAARAGVLARAKNVLGQLAPQDFSWEGEVSCAVAIKDTTAQYSCRSGEGPLTESPILHGQRHPRTQPRKRRIKRRFTRSLLL